VVLLVVLVRNRSGYPMSFMTRDPTAVAGVPAYCGMLSNLGVLGWCTASATCLFTSTVVKPRSRDAEFLKAAGLFSLWLGIDDLFLMHETVLPSLLHVHEKVVVASYMLVLGCLLVRHRETIRTSDYRPLLGALGFFLGSVVIDTRLPFVGEPLPFHVSTAVEDMLKFVGIVCWMVYFWNVSREAVART